MRRASCDSGYAKEDHVARIGTEKHPAFARVQTEERLEQVAALCHEHNIQFVIELAPGKSEDITDIERALSPPIPATSAPKTGRNDPCPCGSGKKFKKCCGSGALSVGS
jgi:SWIM/SEC-C metal-binding protein